MRLTPIFACALLLGGCNVVYSQKPLFDAADAGPGLKPGVWAKPGADCKFDSTASAKSWPECAHGMLVKGGKLIDPSKPGKDIEYLLAAGDPPVMQIPFAQDNEPKLWFYGGLRVSQRDAKGQITAFSAWLAQCGPPPPPPKEGDTHPRYVTDKPFPGLRVDEKTNLCEATAKQPVRVAVKGSEIWSDDKGVATWIRDGDD